ncbi:hypothetical protein CSUI_006009 [Cystoisospora suis]|uniref:Uncharacterized protein n=1 Tax=Cystoisospora suis TaxID=483139 RepID=A0A2C6KRU1_9APIC|nr:hypothetical protein CSUI_006009 [Cystoisospora suis]
MSLSSYTLRSLKVIYTSRQRSSLQATIDNLKTSLTHWSTPSSSCPSSLFSSSSLSSSSCIPWPVPRRLARRQWRVTYLKSPFKFKYSLRHYVFVDYRYSFTFYDVKEVQKILGILLGSMTETVSCSCRFSWHFPGSGLLLSHSHEGSKGIAGGEFSPTIETPQQLSDKHLPSSSSIANFSSSDEVIRKEEKDCRLPSAPLERQDENDGNAKKKKEDENFSQGNLLKRDDRCVSSPSSLHDAIEEEEENNKKKEEKKKIGRGELDHSSSSGLESLLRGHSSTPSSFVKECLEEEQAIQRIEKRVDRKYHRHWYPGKNFYWAPR